jgi:hypothetical protein
MSFSNVGKVWTPETLREYLRTLERPEWVEAICLHHTAAPSLAQRPQGLKPQHIVNIRDFYREKGWASGPHFFTDEDQIFGMTPPGEKGIHAVSFNRSAIGIEVLGDYDVEEATTGRGLACWSTTAFTVTALLDWLGLSANPTTILFHRDDPKTSKTCPGSKVGKEWVLNLIAHAQRGSVVATEPEQDPKPTLPAGKTWDRWARKANFWAVPVAGFMHEVMGVPWQVIREQLHQEHDGFHYGEELLEGAYYDGTETWGSAKELLGLVA